MATLSFGKHRGKTFEEVATTDAGYCKWVLAIDGPKGAMAEFQGFLKARSGGEPVSPGAALAAPPPQGHAAAVQAAGLPPAAAQPLHGGGSSPGAAPRLPGAGAAAPPVAGGDSQLPPHTCFVLEATSRERFCMRAEMIDQESGGCVGQAAWLPRALWQEVAGWPGQQLQGDRWSFPLGCHAEVVSRLASRGWRCEPVPSFLLKQLEQAAHVAPEPSAELLATRLPRELMPYQREGVLFGYTQANGRVLIGDEMGLGKTLQALVLASLFREEWPVLVICPSSLRFVWKEQAGRWLPDLCGDGRVQVIKSGKESFREDAAVWVISYNLLAAASGAKYMSRPCGNPHQLVICDESHNIKEWSAKRTKAAVQILQKADHAILLSGTPTRNTPDELHAQLAGLQLPGLFSYASFRRRYCIEKNVRLGTGQVFKKITGARNANELNLMLTSSVMIRRKKADVLHELPPLRRQKVPIEPGNNKIATEIRKAMQNLADGADLAALFTKLVEIKLPDVKEYVLDVLDRGDQKFIVFAHHRAMLDGIEEVLDKKLRADGLSHIRIDGSTPSEKRLALVNVFQDDPKCRVAVLSITACAEGLTLTAAGLVVFAELYWVPGIIEQAEARAHRVGTTHNKVVVEFLIVNNSPDEIVYRKLERKSRDTSHVLDNVEAEWRVEVQETRCSKRPGTTDAPGSAGGTAAAGLEASAAATEPAAAESSEPPWTLASIFKRQRVE